MKSASRINKNLTASFDSRFQKRPGLPRGCCDRYYNIHALTLSNDGYISHSFTTLSVQDSEVLDAQFSQI